MKDLFLSAGLRNNQNILVHSSFRRIKKEFSLIAPEEVIFLLQEILTEAGSLIMPAFTYNWKLKLGIEEVFDRQNSPSKTGALSEVFRKQKNVIRTSSPTHSFCIWGDVTNYISENNSPYSPLGEGSVLDWLANRSDSYILMIGTDFSSLSFGHYLEIFSKVPWYNYSPWDKNITEYGISISGEQKLKEIPGCSKSFTSFEMYLKNKNLITPVYKNDLCIMHIPVPLLAAVGKKYFQDNHLELLCREGTCKPCDTRRKYLKERSTYEL
jgi:aminoglycoside 3-N-acetyltransferase